VSVKHSDETREKLRQASLGRPVSEETRRKLSALRKGKPNPPLGRASSNACRISRRTTTMRRTSGRGSWRGWQRCCMETRAATVS